ncbi:T9SS type A sorting domain-containing protein [Empedobacter falsenii]
MRKLFYLLTFTASSLLFGQIELQKTIDEEVSAYSTNVETYYVSTFKNKEINTINIYDKNFNLYKNFNVEIPSGYKNLSINNPKGNNSFSISKGIFSTDNKLCVIVIFDKYLNGAENYVKIYNEDGKLLKDFGKPFDFYSDNSYDNFQVLYDKDLDINKLIITSIDYYNEGGKAFTDIYTLPSKTLSVNDNNIVTNSLKIYPNPVNSILTIDNPNNGNSEAKVFDMTGKLVKNMTFNVNDKNISLNVSDLLKGNYIIKIGNSVTKIIKN